MRAIGFILVFTATALWSSAGDVTVGGVVVNRNGAAIEGAAVTLLPAGVTTVTGADGRFAFDGQSVSVDRNVSCTSAPRLDPVVVNGNLRMSLRKRSRVEITAFGPDGRTVAAASTRLDAGNHLVRLLHRGPGLYLNLVRVDDVEYIIRGTVLNQSVGAAGVCLRRDVSMALQKSAVVAAGVYDEFTLEITSDGFVDQEVTIDDNSDYSDLTIVQAESEGTVTDIDGNVYQTVRIGEQVWMVENLRTTRYNDGEAIPLVPDTAEWGNSNVYQSTAERNNGDPKPQYCFYNNTTDPDTIQRFGALYNWWVVKTGKLAPEGWKVPDTADWLALRDYLLENPFETDASTEFELVVKSMAAGIAWMSSDEQGTIGNDFTANNLSGFSAIPAGYRTGSAMILYMLAGERGYWWTSTEKHPNCPCWFTLYDFLGTTNYLGINDADFGLSVRCIKEQEM